MSNPRVLLIALFVELLLVGLSILSVSPWRSAKSSLVYLPGIRERLVCWFRDLGTNRKGCCVSAKSQSLVRVAHKPTLGPARRRVPGLC